MPPRKKRATAAAQPKESSPLKKAVIEAITCPITRQLVVDPVVAEDGNTYESAAIKQWLATSRRSPMTNEMMGDRLTASRKTRDLVQRGVRSLHFVRRRPCDSGLHATLRTPPPLRSRRIDGVEVSHGPRLDGVEGEPRPRRSKPPSMVETLGPRTQGNGMSARPNCWRREMYQAVLARPSSI